MSSTTGKINPSFALNLIGILIGLLGIALVTLTTNPIIEIVAGVIVAVGVAMIAISKHLG
ncbi:MAG: hypothetical protein AABX13_01040 [Nanoarchaeota archaeon]